MTAGYEILEHTADIGIRAWGPTLEDCFVQASLGLSELLAAKMDPGPGQGTEVIVLDAERRDPGGLLVDLLNELIFLHETRRCGFVDFQVAVSERIVEVKARVGDIGWETETTGVKAATYHRLEVREVAGGVEARVYLDV
jgi:SHS2 domain-containing protein